MALYITWTEQESKFDSWRVVNGLGTEPVFKTFTKKVKARYSTDESEKMIERANAYIKSDMQDKTDVRVIKIKD